MNGMVQLSRRMCSSRAFTWKGDRFKGVTMPFTAHWDVPAVKSGLVREIARLKADGRRGVWLQVPAAQSELLPFLISNGFEIHHAKREYIALTQWLPTDQSNGMPTQAHTNVGVGGFVVDEAANAVLLIREQIRVSDRQMTAWKLPGGLKDPAEDIGEAVVREVFEETGVRSEFSSLFGLRFKPCADSDTGIWDDIYFLCRLRPISTTLQPCPREVEECRWVPVPEVRELLAEAQMSTLQAAAIEAALHPHSGKGELSRSIIKSRANTRWAKYGDQIMYY